MATHSSTLAWKIPWTEDPGGLQSMGSLRVGHDWATSLSLSCIGEGNGNPLQCSYLENPRDGEPGGLPSMGSHRVGHDWSNLAAAAALAGGFFTTSTTWEALGSISHTLIANRGRRHWLQSRNLELWWEMTSEPFRSVRYSRRMKPDGWPAQLGHLVWQVIERSHSASPGTTWQAAGQSERRARAWAGCKQSYTPRQEASSHVTPWETGAGAWEGYPWGRWGALRLWRQGALGALTYPAYFVHKKLNSQWRGWVELIKKSEVAKPRPRENQKVDITCRGWNKQKVKIKLIQIRVLCNLQEIHLGCKIGGRLFCFSFLWTSSFSLCSERLVGNQREEEQDFLPQSHGPCTRQSAGLLEAAGFGLLELLWVSWRQGGPGIGIPSKCFQVISMCLKEWELMF